MLKQNLSVQEINKIIAAENAMVCPTKYKFLLHHSGLRPARLHGLIGTAGSGKSSLFKSIIAHASEGKKCLVWLTEESYSDYQMGMMRYVNLWPNIKFFEESSIPEHIRHNQADFLKTAEMIVQDSEADYWFIDNIHTGRFYSDDLGPQGQTRSADFLACAPKKLGVGIFYSGHTKREVTDNFHRLIDKEDIRGSSILAMRTEYFYCMQCFIAGDDKFNFIRTVKFRHHEEASGFYRLYFDNGKYLKDGKVAFHHINEIFKIRNRLGSK